jgi:hypothetical protein
LSRLDRNLSCFVFKSLFCKKGTLWNQFRSGDVRSSLSLAAVDPRIHFALNCGAKSCPPIRVFSPKNLERGLQLAAEGFLRDTTTLEGQVLTVSKVLI